MCAASINDQYINIKSSINKCKIIQVIQNILIHNVNFIHICTSSFIPYIFIHFNLITSTLHQMLHLIYSVAHFEKFMNTMNGT